MFVSIKFYYFELFGEGSLEIFLNEGATIEDALKEVNKIFVNKLEKKVEKIFNIFLNGVYLNVLSNSELKLKNGDKLVFLRPVGGGY